MCIHSMTCPSSPIAIIIDHVRSFACGVRLKAWSKLHIHLTHTLMHVAVQTCNIHQTPLLNVLNIMLYNEQLHHTIYQSADKYIHVQRHCAPSVEGPREGGHFAMQLIPVVVLNVHVYLPTQFGLVGKILVNL